MLFYTFWLSALNKKLSEQATVSVWSVVSFPTKLNENVKHTYLMQLNVKGFCWKEPEWIFQLFLAIGLST